MRRSGASLGLKLNLALLLFFLVLGAATAVLLLYGFNRTQDNAKTRSQEALEELGQVALLGVVAGQADYGGLALESASETGFRAAQYLESFQESGATIAVDPSRFTKNAQGITYDPDPNRITDVVMPNYVELDQTAVDEIEYSAPLDAILPALMAKLPDSIRQENFDAIAISFVGANSTARYYPPIGIQDIVAPDADLRTVAERLGPENNPERKTNWRTPYEDAAGNGLVMTVEVPVYDHDVYKGAFQIDISLAKLVAQIDLLKLTTKGFAFYVDADGEVIQGAARDLITGEVDGGNAQLVAVLDAMRNNQEGVQRVTIGGEEMFVGYSPVAGIGGSLGLAASVEEITASAAEITSGIEDEGQRTLRVTLLAMGAVFVAGLIGATYLNRRVLIRPIEALASATRSVAQGNFDTQISVKGNDEMAALGRSFNQMTADIQREVQEREAAESELAALFAAMTDAVVVINSDGYYVRVPRTNAPPLLIPPEDLPGKALHDVMPPDQADAFVSVVREALSTRRTATVEYPLVIDDRTYWFSAAVSPVSAGEVVVVARDITERVNARQELERQVTERTRELTTLLTVSRNVASTLELRPLLALVIEELKTVADYSRGSVLTVEGDNFAVLNTQSNFADSNIMQRFPISNLEPVSSRIMRAESVIIPDVLSDTPEAEAYRRVTSGLFSTSYTDIHSWLVVPLVLQDRVIGFLSLAHSEPGFYTEHQAGLVRAIATQIAVAIENARLYEQAQQLAAVEERQRLARELHDSVSQALYGIALGARTARTLLDDDPSRAVEPVDYVLQLAEAGLAEMRALIFELRPESLETEGLVAAIEKQAAATKARYGIDVSTNLDGEPDLDISQKEVLYRVAQEALHNVVKHARASHVSVTLSREDGGVTLQVSDDGIGFDPGHDFPGHMGLVSMRERAASIGASLDVQSQPGSGTTLKLSLPGTGEAN